MGQNLEQLITRADERYCFRRMDQRVYYVRCVRSVHINRSAHRVSTSCLGDQTPAVLDKPHAIT